MSDLSELSGRSTLPRLRKHRLARELVISTLVVLAFYTFFELAIPRSVVRSISMQPNLVEDQRLVISRLTYLLGQPQRGDIIVFQPPPPEDTDELWYIKRLIGLPGETIGFMHDHVYVNGVPLDEPYLNEACSCERWAGQRWVLAADEYFVMGDNRNHSHDSRDFGPIHRDSLIGRAILRFWPPTDLGLFASVNYTY